MTMPSTFVVKVVGGANGGSCMRWTGSWILQPFPNADMPGACLPLPDKQLPTPPRSVATPSTVTSTLFLCYLPPCAHHTPLQCLPMPACLDRATATHAAPPAHRSTCDPPHHGGCGCLPTPPVTVHLLPPFACALLLLTTTLRFATCPAFYLQHLPVPLPTVLGSHCYYATPRPRTLPTPGTPWLAGTTRFGRFTTF